MLFLLVSSSQISLLMNPQEPSRRPLLSPSSTFVHCFCCLRNKNMKVAIVAACWATVTALRMLARGCSHPAGSDQQGTHCQVGLGVSQAHHRMTRCFPSGMRSTAVWKQSLQRVHFHPTALGCTGTSCHGSSHSGYL